MKLPARALLVTLLILGLLLVFAATTQTGLKLLWLGIQPVLPAAVSIDSVAGRLTGPLSLTGLKVRSDAVSLTLGHAELDWTPSRLLFGELRVDRLELEDIHYQPGEAPAKAAPEPTAIPERIALPVDLSLGLIRLRNLVVESSDGGGGLRIDQGAAGLDYRNTALQIRHVSVQSTDFYIEGSGRLTTAADYPMEAVLDWRLRPPGYAEIHGNTALAGTLKRLRITQTFQAPYALSGDLLLAGLTGVPDVQANIRVDGLALQAINRDFPAMGFTGDIRADGPLDSLALSGTLDVQGEAFPPVHASVAAMRSSAGVDIQSLQLTVPDTGTEVHVAGPLRFAAGATQFDLRADWEQLRWPLAGEAQVQSPRGRLHLKGSPQDYGFDAGMTLAARAYPGAELVLRGGGNLEGLQVSQLGAETLDGHIEGTAAIAWQPRFETRVDLRGQSLNPGAIHAAWPGKLDMQLAGSAVWSPDGLEARIPRLQVTGNLRDLPVRLDGEGAYQAATLSVTELALVSGPSSLQLSGSVGERFALDWRVASPDLNTLHPAAAGQLTGHGRLSGTPAAPVGTARLSGADLRFRNDRLSTLSLDTVFDLTAATASNLELDIGTGQVQGISVKSVRLRAAGLPAKHRVDLQADSSLVVGQLLANGDWKQDVWHFDLQRAELSHPGFAPWVLDHSVRGRLGRDSLAADRSCWRSGEARLCLDGTFTPTARSGKLELTDLPFSYFAGLLPAGVAAEGTLDVAGAIDHRPGRAASARLGLDSQTLALRFPGTGAQPDTRIAATRTRLDLDMLEGEARLGGQLDLDNGAQLSLTAKMRDSRQDFLERTLNGRIVMEIPDIAVLAAFTRQISDAQGSLQGDVRIGGSLRAPVLQGEISTGDSRLTLEQPGITLENVRIKVAGKPDGALVVDMAGQSGDGQLAIKGTGNLHAGLRAARFRIRGEDFLVMDTREASIRVSPDLELRLDAGDLDIEGQVVVPSASIKPRKLPESSVSVSRDQIIVRGDEETVAASGYRISSSVRFILGEQVRIDAFGLKGRLTGNLVARDQPGKPTTANGELAILEGRYRAYGQNLDIRTGRLVFAGGPLAEPGLDIEAVRRPDPGILVGVRARGRIRNPEFSLFSEPSMSQSDQLSWLVLGRPMESDTSSQDKNSINQAAVTLGLGQSLALTEEFGEKLGIDEISIESEPDDETSQASLLVGKYLSPKLFVSYGVGIFDPISTLRFRYALGSKWKLVGESSALRSSTDLYYVIEVGK